MSWGFILDCWDVSCESESQSRPFSHPFPAPCDASGLLPSAADVGDCSSALPSGSSCANTPSLGLCSPSVCNDGVLSEGFCGIGAFPGGRVEPSLDPSLPDMTLCDLPWHFGVWLCRLLLQVAAPRTPCRGLTSPSGRCCWGCTKT